VRPFEKSGRSANMAYYRERGTGDRPRPGSVWCSVVENAIDFLHEGDAVIATRRRVWTYSLSVYREGEDQIVRFEYEPATGSGELPPRTVARLVRRELAAGADT
jgi:hypothetical protein